MKNPCTSLTVKPESHLINVSLHFVVLLSEGWMTEWVLGQEKSTCQIAFNLTNLHAISFSAVFGEKFKWKAEMLGKTPKLQLQSLSCPPEGKPCIATLGRRGQNKTESLRKQLQFIWIFFLNNHFN